MIFEPDGVERGYFVSTLTTESWIGNFTITDKWIDAEGTIWYKWLETVLEARYVSDHDVNFCLGKISDSGRVLEFSISSYDYPNEAKSDSLKYDYHIYYRQE